MGVRHFFGVASTTTRRFPNPLVPSSNAPFYRKNLRQFFISANAPSAKKELR